MFFRILNHISLSKREKTNKNNQTRTNKQTQTNKQEQQQTNCWNKTQRTCACDWLPVPCACDDSLRFASIQFGPIQIPIQIPIRPPFFHHLALIDTVPPVSVVVALPSAAAAARPSAAAAARPSAAVAARPLSFPLGLAAAVAVFPWVGGPVRP